MFGKEAEAHAQWELTYEMGEKYRPGVHEGNAFRAGWRAAKRGEEAAPKDATPETPNHYTRLKTLTGVEAWDILDFVAGDDPDMWNLGKYWFRMGHKEGQSTLTEKKKMLKYLERSIEKEEAAE